MPLQRRERWVEPMAAERRMRDERGRIECEVRSEVVISPALGDEGVDGVVPAVEVDHDQHAIAGHGGDEAFTLSRLEEALHRERLAKPGEVEASCDKRLDGWRDPRR